MEYQTEIESAAFELSLVIDLQTSGRLRLRWPELNPSYFHYEETMGRQNVWPGAQHMHSPVHQFCPPLPSIFKTQNIKEPLWPFFLITLFCVAGPGTLRSKTSSFLLSIGSEECITKCPNSTYKGEVSAWVLLD